MRAVTVREYGGPEVLAVLDRPTPEPGAGQVRVRVAGAGVNPVDPGTRAGYLAGMSPVSPPFVLGWELTGTVDAVGPQAAFEVGQPVVGLSDWFATGVGTQAEQVVLDAGQLAPAPSTASLQEAAGLPLNGLTAMQALDLLALPPGSTVVVTGAAGGLGGYAVELATARGLRVVAYVGANDEGLVRGFGAVDVVVRSEEPAAAVRSSYPDGVDGVLDAAALGAGALGAVRDGGAYVGVLVPAQPEPERGIEPQTVRVHSDSRQLAELAARVDAGQLTLRLAEALPFERAGEAHQRIDKGGVRGRLVLIP